MKIFLLIICFLLLISLTNIKVIAIIDNDDRNIRVKAFGICIYDLKKRDNKKNRKKTEKNSDKRKKEKPKSENLKENTSGSSEKEEKKSETKPIEEKETDSSDKEANQDDLSLKSLLKSAFDEENKEVTSFMIQSFLKSCGKIIKSTKIKNLFIDIRVSDFDAYETAEQYIKCNQILWYIVGVVSSIFSVYQKKITIKPDFGKDESRYDIRFSACIRFCNLFAILAQLAISLLKLIIALKTGNKPVKINENKNMITEKEYEMKEENQLNGLMGVTMDKIREMVDVNTIIGEQIKVNDNVTIIPVSKVSYGFGSGGSDLPVKNTTKDLFGGGAGAGVTIKPIGFLTVTGDNVKLIQVKEDYKASNSIADIIPGAIDAVTSIVSSVKDGTEDDEKKDRKFFKRRKKSSEEVQPDTEDTEE